MAYLILGIVSVWVPNYDPHARFQQYRERFADKWLLAAAILFVALLVLFIAYPARGWGIDEKWKSIHSLVPDKKPQATQDETSGAGKPNSGPTSSRAPTSSGA